MSAQRPVMSMMIIPLPHYENFEVGKKKMCRSPPPPPPPLKADVAFQCWRSSSEAFPPPPLSKHPAGAAPVCYIYSNIKVTEIERSSFGGTPGTLCLNTYFRQNVIIPYWWVTFPINGNHAVKRYPWFKLMHNLQRNIHEATFWYTDNILFYAWGNIHAGIT